MSWVEVARFVYRHEAETAVALLKDAGIAAELFADDCGGLHPGLLTSNPARLVVLEEEAESARQVLKRAGDTVIRGGS